MCHEITQSVLQVDRPLISERHSVVKQRQYLIRKGMPKNALDRERKNSGRGLQITSRPNPV